LYKILYHGSKRLTLIVLEICAAVLGVVFVLGMLVIWRANQGPIVIDSLAPQLARLLSNEATGTRTEIGHAQLMWNKTDQALRLVTTTVRVYDRNNHQLATLPQLSLGLNFLAPLRGQLAPLEIFSHDFSLHLTRTAEGRFLFGDIALDSEPAATPAVEADITTVLQKLLQLDSGWFGVGRVGAVRLTQIRVVVTDQATQREWAVMTLPQFTVVRQHGAMQMRGAVTARLGTGVTSSLNLAADYDGSENHLTVRVDFAALNPAQWARALALSALYGAMDATVAGDMTLQLDDQIRPEMVRVQVSGGAGTLTLPDLWQQPLALTGFALNAALYPIEHRLSLQEAVLDLGGVKLSVQAEAAPENAQEPDALAVTAQAAITNWPLDRVAEIWPPSVAPNPRAWIVANMSAGIFNEVSAITKLKTSWQNPAAMHDLSLQGKIILDGATVKYVEGMPPVKGVHGTAEADQSTLRINIAGGKADRVTLGASPIVITGLNGDNQDISLNLTGKNSVSDVLRLIDHPPFNYARALGLKPEQMSGMADLDIKIGFPLLKDLPLAAMQIDARAKISDFASDKLVKGLAIKQGNLALAVDSKQLTVQGKAAYNGVTFATNYHQLFAAPSPPTVEPQAKAVLQGDLTAVDLAMLGLPITGDMVSGTIPTTLNYDKGFTTSGILQLAADFTAARVSLPMLNWEKAAQKPAQAKVKLVLDKAAVQLQQFDLVGEKLKVAVTGTLDGATLQPKNLACAPCKIGRTDMRAKLGFVSGKLADISISGAALDYHDTSSTKPADKTAPTPLRAKLDLGKLYQGNEHFFANLRGTLRRSSMGWEMMDLRAVAEGRVPLFVLLTPHPNGSRKLSITTDDLGDVLRGADVTDQVHGGRLQIIGSSTTQQPYKINGTIELRKYRVRQLPFLAILLNAASITGIADIMAGEGLSFDRLEGGFVWQGDRITLEDVRTSGGALGLNVEGALDFGTHQADLQGTVVPFSFFNGIIGTIPLVGDILTGGKGGGVIAATYQAKGDMSKMDIAVNPVSFLAPGILRRIFFQN